VPPELPEPRSRPLEQIRFSADEDILGVSYALMWARPDAVTCGIEPVAGELPRGVLDIDWIPRVAAHGWVAITKNHKIRSNPVEARAAVEAEARIVGFAGRSGNMTRLHLSRHLLLQSVSRLRWLSGSGAVGVSLGRGLG
jgi:PIN like domain